MGAGGGISKSKTDTEIANMLISLAVVLQLDMADKTHNETTLSRADAAEYLRSLGATLAGESGSWTVPVGNKRVEIQPDDEITVETTVDERSRMLGDDITSTTVELRWKESGESAEGGD